METIQKSVVGFIESQFPAFYRDYGPVFIEFVKSYYSWMEGSQTVANKKQSIGSISISAANTLIVGANTTFTTDVANGEMIAVYRDSERYDLFTVNSVTSDTTLVVSETPQFTNAVTMYANTAVVFNPTYYQRRLLEFTDVDDTTDQFITHFKNQYLVGLQFTTESDIRLLLKHTLDLYRSKGTPRAVDLLFRLVFGTDVDIYYPGSDVFKLSSGAWKKPRYIEISLNSYADQLVGLQVKGQTSGATAFVEKLVRRTINGRFIDVLYVSDILGTFILGEKINSPVKAIPSSEAPIMIGSLTGVQVDQNGIGEGFHVGDLVDLYSHNGGEAIARVSSITNTGGIIHFDLNDGGFAYTANSLVITSDQTLTINTVTSPYNLYNPNYYSQGETLQESYANVSYLASNGSFGQGTNVYMYYANGTLQGSAIVLDSFPSNSTAGSIVIEPLSGNVVANAIYSLANAVGATVNVVSGIVWANASAEVLSVSNTVTLYVNTVSAFTAGDLVYQQSDIGIHTAIGTISKLLATTSSSILTVDRTDGMFQSGNTLFSNSGGQGNTLSVQLAVSTYNTNGAFYTNGMNIVVGSRSNGTVTAVSLGAGANVSLSGNLIFTETIALNNVYINTYSSHTLANAVFNFPASPTGNLTTGTIDSMMSNVSVQIGRIATISTTQGTNYTTAPDVVIIEPLTAPYYKYDRILSVDSGGFFPEEEITQSATGAHGIVNNASNNSVLDIRRLYWEDTSDFVVTTNSTTTIVGLSSGKTANVLSVSVSPLPELGFNAIVYSSLAISNSSIAGLDVVESGYGFVDGEQVVVSSPNTVMIAFANVYTVGVGRGYYDKQGGFLSGRQKIYDGKYYQQYSYDVRSSVTLDKYQDMLKQVVHTAGTMLFGTFIHSAEVSHPSQVESAVITISTG